MRSAWLLRLNLRTIQQFDCCQSADVQDCRSRYLRRLSARHETRRRRILAKTAHRAPKLTEYIPIIHPVRSVLRCRNRRAITSVRSHCRQVFRAFFPRVVRCLPHPSEITLRILEIDHVAVFVARKDIIPVLRKILPYICDSGSVPRTRCGVV